MACLLLANRFGLGATLIVTNTSDSDPGSLRQAILNSNANPGNDTITFNISGAGVHQILLMTPLPHLTDPAGVVIDGYTQPGAAVNASTVGDDAVILIAITQSPGQGIATGLTVASDNNIIQGIAVNGMTTDSIEVVGGDNNIIRGNFIGTDAAGLVAVPSLGGLVLFGASNTRIGGPTPADRNLISGNLPGGGLFLENGTTGTVVQGNLIGLDATGMHALPNFNGIEIASSSANVVGGISPGTGNIISGNQGEGIGFGGGFTTGNVVEGNVIGTAADRTTPLPNRLGIIATADAGPNLIGGGPGAGNLIAHNLNQGVVIGANAANLSPGNAILSNLIFANGGPGIDLGFDLVTPNDPGDVDTGPNGLQNYPAHLQALESLVSGDLFVSGTQDSRSASGSNQLQLFLAEGPGNGGARALLLDGPGYPAGAFSFAIPSFAPLSPVTPGDWLTATATTTEGTSEFSQNVQVVANVSPHAVTGPNQTVPPGTFVNLDGSGSFDPDSAPSGPAIAAGSYSWAQVTGPAVTLTGANTARASFVPSLPGIYRFSLAVSDGLDVSTNTATTTITVRKRRVPIVVPPRL